MTRYEPRPIDTSNVSLPPEIAELTEELARNNHDIWARGRIAEGWKYGPQRDDGSKEHPCLVPYEELPDAEKEYDRATALETIKTLLALGSKITSPALAKKSTVRIADLDIAGTRDLLCGPGFLELPALLNIWQIFAPTNWSTPTDAAEYLRRPSGEVRDITTELAHRMLKIGEPILAQDVLQAGLVRWPADLRLRQLMALALARSGAARAAGESLEKLRAEHEDKETLGILARTYKDLWADSTDPAEGRAHLEKSFATYLEAYRKSRQDPGGTPEYYTGINAAATALWLGRKEEAREIAGEVREICRELLAGDDSPTPPGELYWRHATLAEASLILEDLQTARREYAAAAEIGRGNHAELTTTRRQARRILDAIGDATGGDRSVIDPLRIPGVVIFAGHMIDRPGRAESRFPPALEDRVARAIQARLAELEAGIGYSSAACGSDILFLEAMIARGGEIHVVLPFEPERFEATSVDLVRGAEWLERFRAVLSRASRVLIASDRGAAGGSTEYEYANLLVEGLAILRARALDTDLTTLVVCDALPGGKRGGTNETVRRWRSRGAAVDRIEIDPPGVGASPEQTAGRRRFSEPARGQEIMAMLFADAVGYSKLTEAEVPRFLEDFLGEVARLIERSPGPPVTRNSWGDAIYLVFRSLEAAGNTALELVEMIRRTRWADRGLPADLDLRVALHAGPVLPVTDPIVGAPNFIGAHVSRAARIEPITPPGQIYASLPFAAIAAAQGIESFTCEYVGQTPLPKGYGTYPTYHVRRWRLNR